MIKYILIILVLFTQSIYTTTSQDEVNVLLHTANELSTYTKKFDNNSFNAQQKKDLNTLLEKNKELSNQIDHFVVFYHQGGYSALSDFNARYKELLNNLKELKNKFLAFESQIELSSFRSGAVVPSSSALQAALITIKQPLDKLCAIHKQIRESNLPIIDFKSQMVDGKLTRHFFLKYDDQTIADITQKIQSIIASERTIQTTKIGLLKKSGIDITELSLRVLTSFYISLIKKEGEYVSHALTQNTNPYYEAVYSLINHTLMPCQLVANKALNAYQNLLVSYNNTVAQIIVPICAYALTQLAINPPHDMPNATTINYAQLFYKTLKYYNATTNIEQSMIQILQRSNEFLCSISISEYDQVAPIVRQLKTNYDLLIHYTSSETLAQKFKLSQQAILRLQSALKEFDAAHKHDQPSILIDLCTRLVHDFSVLDYKRAAAIFGQLIKNTWLSIEHQKEIELSSSMSSLDDVINLLPTGPLNNPYNSIQALQNIQHSLDELNTIHVQTTQSINNLFMFNNHPQLLDEYKAIGIFIDHCLTFFNVLQKCAIRAQLATPQALYDAEALYTKLINYAHILDRISIQTHQHPFIQQLTSFSYEKCAAVFIARSYVWTANTALDDSAVTLKMNYYLTAQSKSALLPAAINGIIKTYFKKISQQSESVYSLMHTLKEQSRLFLGSVCPSIQGADYENDFTKNADTLLHQSWIAYSWGQKEALTYYMTAADYYIKEYSKYAQSHSMSRVKYISILYGYALMLKSTQQTHKLYLLINQHIVPALGEYSTYARNLLEQLEHPSLKRAQVIENALEDLNIWQQSTDWLLAKQDQAVKLYARILQDLYSMYKGKKQDGSTYYTFYAVKDVLTVPVLPNLRCKLYQLFADQALNQQHYRRAQKYYQKASLAYGNINDVAGAQLANQSMELSKTLYYAQYYDTLIVPQGAVTIGNFKNVPVFYKMSAYQQLIPYSIATLLPQKQSITSKEQLISLAITTALDVFIYNALNAHYSTQDAQKWYITLVSAIQNDKKISLDDELVVNIMNDAQQFKKIITAQPFPIIEGIKSTTLQNTYKISIYNLAIDAIPLKTAPYGMYPNAFSYYVLAHSLYGPQPITLGQVVLAAGNQPDKESAMKDKMLKTWLSHGYISQQAINKLKDSSLYQTLKNISPQDINFSLKQSKDLFEKLYNLYGPLEQKSNYEYPLWISYAMGNKFTSQNTQEDLKELIRQTYKNAADDLRVFLKGNPLGSMYNRCLKIVVSYYEAAIQQGYDQDLYQSIGDLYNNVGTLLQSYNNYFSALSYFENAKIYYQKIKSPQLASLQKSIILCQVHAAIDQLVQYAHNKQHPLEYTDNEGSSHTIDFIDLINNHDQSDQEQRLVQQAQNTLLNALIVLSFLSAQAPANTDQKYTLSAHNVDEYMKSNSIDLSNPEHVDQFMLKNNIASLCLSLFNKVINQDDMNTAFIWASRLYNAGMLAYMNDFFGQVSSNSFESLNKAIGARAAAIQMNPTLSIG